MRHHMRLRWRWHHHRPICLFPVKRNALFFRRKILFIPKTFFKFYSALRSLQCVPFFFCRIHCEHKYSKINYRGAFVYFFFMLILLRAEMRSIYVDYVTPTITVIISPSIDFFWSFCLKRTHVNV